MGSHRFHPNPFKGDPEKAILYDDCPGCEQHAHGDGLTLDRLSFARAWNQMIRVERNDGAYRTVNEALLCRCLYHTAMLIERHPEITEPWLMIDAEDDD